MKIGITGTIGSGKSTVTEYIKSLGFNTFSCDEYNAHLLQKGNLGYLKVKEIFPECFLNEELDKAKLANIVFGNSQKRELLESIMHPLIILEMDRLSNICDPFFAEVPVLFEKGLQDHFDKTFLVTCRDNIALRRLEKRGLPNDLARNRIACQMPLLPKKKLASEIIYNNNDLNFLYEQVDRLINIYVG